jgi:proteasome lid subunit RPN8/RPN11
MTFEEAIVSPDVIAAIQAHAIAEFPREACGLITPDGFEQRPNIHPDPERFFRCAADDELRAGRLLGVVHSHTNGNPAPSSQDIAQQIALDVPFGLLQTDGRDATTPFWWGDSLTPPPLVGRHYRWGPSGTDGKGTATPSCATTSASIAASC